MDTMMEYKDPSDKSLIDDYLRPKISGKHRVHGSFVIHDSDVYSDHPYNLTLQHEPAAVAGGRTTWYFLSPARYIGGKKAARSWTVIGADGKKKGTWNPRRTKRVVEGSDGGYFRTLTYQETTPAGGAIRPGWMMVEYGVSEDHGGGDVVLCKVYRSPANGAGSDSPSASPARKRKQADAVEEHPEAPTSARRRQEMDDDDMAFAQSLESDLMCYFGIENDSPGAEHASPEHRDQPDAAVAPCSARPEEAAVTRVQPSADDDDVMEISVEDFLCSSVAPTAQPENASTSSPHGQCTDSIALIDDVSDDEVLACPPMDDEYVERITSEALVQFNPSFIQEFICDD